MGEDEEERGLSDSAPVGSFNAVCQKRLTRANGSTKSGKRAVCTLCSACSNYNSGWCADNCDQYGKRVQVSNKNTINIPNGLRNRIAESQPHVPKNCLKDRFRRLEDEDEEERELSDSAPVGSFNAVCQKRLTKPNGSTKSGKKAVCTLCSACTDYNSGWCADNCDQYGERVQFSNKNRITGLTGCIAGDQPHVPKNCVRQLRRLEEEDDESSEERELGAPLGAFSDDCQERLTKPNGSTKSGK